MMNNDTASLSLLYSCLSLLGLWFIVFWLFRDYNVDAFRQKMFALRDELFDLAADGIISFDHPAYGMLRNVMNGMIRFGHRLSLFNWLLMVASQAYNAEQALSFSKRWEENTKDLSAEVKGKLVQYQQWMNLMVMRHLLTSSPLLMLTIVFPLFGLISLKLCMKDLLIWLRKPLDSIDSAALAMGELT